MTVLYVWLKDEFLDFIKKTQKKVGKNFMIYHGDDVDNKIFDRIFPSKNFY